MTIEKALRRRVAQMREIIKRIEVELDEYSVSGDEAIWGDLANVDCAVDDLHNAIEDHLNDQEEDDDELS